MDFHVITARGSEHILSTDDRGRIVTPLPAAPESAVPRAEPAPAPPPPLERR